MCLPYNAFWLSPTYLVFEVFQYIDSKTVARASFTRQATMKRPNI